MKKNQSSPEPAEIRVGVGAAFSTDCLRYTFFADFFCQSKVLWKVLIVDEKFAKQQTSVN